MKTLISNKDYILLDGELIIFNGWEKGHRKVTHSTASLQGVKQLDRILFVKGVDVEELARENCPENYIDESYEDCFKYGFERGYNDNKNEWTDEQFKHAVCLAHWMAINEYSVGDTMTSILSELRPLSLPYSIIIEGEEITKINW